MQYSFNVRMSKRAGLCIFALLLYSGIAHADVKGKVVGIADGDTLTVLDSQLIQHKVRLAEIDAPERKGQAFGNRSRESLSNLCFGKKAVVRDAGRDRYGRLLGTVICDGVNANEEQVRAGMAWVYRQYAKRTSRLYDLENAARAAKVGLWSDPNPVEPWNWRKEAKSGHASR